MIHDKLPLLQSNDAPADDEDADIDDDGADADTSTVSVDYESPADEPGTIPEIHRTLVAPSDITRTPAAVRTGDRWTKAIWAGEYPDVPMDGFFEKLYAAAETSDTDIAVHIDPRDTRETLDTLETRIKDLQADHEYLTEKHRASARGVEKDLTDHEEIYDVPRNTPMEAFDVSTYFAVRGDDQDDVDASDVRAAARRAPANLTPVVPRWSQLDAPTSCSPIATDALDETLDAKTPILGGAVGAMFPSFPVRSPNPLSSTGPTRSTRARSFSIGSSGNPATARWSSAVSARASRSRRSSGWSAGRCTTRTPLS